MRHNEFLQAGESPIAQIRALAPITNALARALLYSHDWSEPPTAKPPAEQFGDWERYVLDELHRRFFDELYVDRREIEKIEDHLKLQRLVVVTGTRGAGKTTALLRVAHRFKNQTAVSLHYVSLRDYATRFASTGSSPDATASAARSTVCDIIYPILFKHFLGANEAVQTEWRLFLLRRDSHFQSLFQLLMLDTKLTSDAPDSSWLEALNVERHKNAWSDAYLAFSAANNEGKLVTLLEFISQKQHHHCIIVIDNIDRYSIRMQREVIEKLIDLSSMRPPFITPVIAVRHGNFQRIDFEGRADNQFFVVKLREPKRTPYSSEEGSLLTQMIRRRLDFVASLDFEHQFEPETLTRLAQNLKYPNRAAFLMRHKEVLTLVQKSLEGDDVLDLYLKWHNGSLRSAASHIYNLLHAFVTDTDPYFRYSTVTRNPVRSIDPLLSSRALRSTTYRHLVFGGRRPPQPPHTVNLFDEPLSLTCSLRFPSMRVLEYLGAQPDHTTQWGKLVADLGLLGMSRNEVFHYLSVLSHGRGFEADGFVLVDIRDTDRKVDMPDSTEIELLSSGLALCDQVSVSCEYIFWMAMYTDVRFRLIDAGEKLGESEAADPNRTISVATKFLCQHVVPAFCEEHRYSGADTATAADRRAFNLNYWTFGRSRSTTRDFYPIRAERSLRKFAVANDVNKEAWTKLQRQLDDATAKCRKIWERFGIPS